MKEYPFAFEISGRLAAFCQSDAWPHQITYPFPTLSSCEGMVKQITVIANAAAEVTKVEICKPIQYYDFAFLNTTAFRYTANGPKKTADMHCITCLMDVCYRIYGITRSLRGEISTTRSSPTRTTNPAHAYQEMLLRRISSGTYRSVPRLGLGDFTPSYFGDFRDTTKVENVNIVVPHMTLRIFNTFKGNGKYAPRDASGPVFAKKGVVDYAALTSR